jgi:uncharacterized protein (TIGR03067 family)
MAPLRVISTLALALAVCGFAPAPRPKPKKVPDLATLSGSWRVVRYHQNGRDMLGVRQLFMRLEKDKLTFQVGEKGVGSSYHISLDPKRTPAAMNWHSGNGNPIRYSAIYRLEGELLSVVFSEARGGPDHDRPTDFKSLRPQDYLIEFRRLPAAR